MTDADDPQTEAAGERLLHVRQKWERQRRPGEVLAKLMIAHGVYWLAEIKGAMTVAGALETLAAEIRGKMISGSVPTEPKPLGWWKNLIPFRRD